MNVLWCHIMSHNLIWHTSHDITWSHTWHHMISHMASHDLTHGITWSHTWHHMISHMASHDLHTVSHDVTHGITWSHTWHHMISHRASHDLHMVSHDVMWPPFHSHITWQKSEHFSETAKNPFSLEHRNRRLCIMKSAFWEEQDKRSVNFRLQSCIQALFLFLQIGPWVWG